MKIKKYGDDGKKHIHIEFHMYIDIHDEERKHLVLGCDV